MSLIEEALRKQLEENDKTKGPVRLAPTPAPAAPPPVTPEPPPPQEAEPVRKAWPMLLAMVIGGIILVVGVAWLLLFGVGMWKRGGAPEKVKPVAKKAAVTAVAPAETAVAKVEETPAVEVKTTGAVESVATPAAKPSVAVTEPPAVAAPAAPASVSPAVGTAPKPEPAAAPEVVVAVETPAPAAEPVETPQVEVVEKVVLPVVWPKLEVNGLIGGGQSGRSAAIINRQMVEPGVVLEGVRVDAIERNGVRLSFQGETRLVAVGGTTE